MRIKRTIHPNLPLILKVTLIRDDDDGERVLVFHTENLLVERADLLEGVARRDGVDEEEAFARAHVLFAHGAVSGQRGCV
jgi:hypothetical protein